MRTATGRTAGHACRRHEIARGTLGDCRLDREGRTHAYNSDPAWVKAAIDEWKAASGITESAIFRSINKKGRVWGNGMTAKVLWEVVRDAASKAGIAKLAPHDLRRTCARLCHLAGGELDQIQFLLGHVSIQTTERYYLQKVDMCSWCPKSPAVNARTWLDSA